jgi:hypothetical protein
MGEILYYDTGGRLISIARMSFSMEIEKSLRTITINVDRTETDASIHVQRSTASAPQLFGTAYPTSQNRLSIRFQVGVMFYPPDQFDCLCLPDARVRNDQERLDDARKISSRSQLRLSVSFGSGFQIKGQIHTSRTPSNAVLSCRLFW